MANEEQVKILKQGAETWNKWREENRDVKPDLYRADLSEANLSEANLIEANLEGANLEGANFYRADLTGADLTGVDLREAKNLTQEQIDSAITDEDTKLPDDLK